MGAARFDETIVAGGEVLEGVVTFNPNLVLGTVLFYDPNRPGYSTVYTKQAMHEIGHAFGLNHYATNHPNACTDQLNQSSAMNDACGVNDDGAVINGTFKPSNQTTSVTPCDFGRLILTYPPCIPTPTPTPTPFPGDCLGLPDWINYPQTGCVFGYTINGLACGRSSYYTNYCNQFGGGYDPQTCSCPDPAACMAPAEGCYLDYFWLDQTCECAAYSPVVVDVLGNGFNLTSAVNGVDFDIAPNSVPERIAWTAGSSDDAFLVLDRNGNGAIDSGSELFGNFSPQPQSDDKNGFLALAMFDETGSGGNNDGFITSADSVYEDLRLWQDANHNGVSEQVELHTLPSKHLAKIELDYRSSRREDEHGNKFKYRAKVFNEQGGTTGRWAWDVFLVAEPTTGNNIYRPLKSVLNREVGFFYPRKLSCRS